MGSHCELVINQSTRLETRSLQVAWKLISAYLALGGSLIYTGSLINTLENQIISHLKICRYILYIV